MKPMDSRLDQVCAVLARLRERHPLVHCLTNDVVKNFTANVLLAIGAAPAMVEHPDEAGEFAGIADALLVNVGTLNQEQIAAARQAVRAAHAASKPWVLDPVAVGAIRLRTEFARELCGHHPTLIRGNASEVMALAGEAGRGRGVDSGDATESALDAGRHLAATHGSTILITGPVDYVTDGRQVVACHNGDAMLTRVTGVGCAQGALAAACLAVADSALDAALAAAVIMAMAGEHAAAVSRQPGSFQTALLDALDAIDEPRIRAAARLG